MNNLFVFLVIFAIIFIIFLFFSKNNKRENYGFAIGALGDYQKQYYYCIKECEKEDRSKYLGKGHGNWSCDLYCNSKFTEIAKEHRKYLDPKSIEPNNIASICQLSSHSTRYEQCIKQCGEDENGRFCRDQCACENEVDWKCTQECAYSTMSNQDCMTLCKLKYGPNCSSTSWNWK